MRSLRLLASLAAGSACDSALFALLAGGSPGASLLALLIVRVVSLGCGTVLTVALYEWVPAQRKTDTPAPRRFRPVFILAATVNLALFALLIFDLPEMRAEILQVLTALAGLVMALIGHARFMKRLKGR